MYTLTIITLDTISFVATGIDTNVTQAYNFTQKGIAWPSDRQKYGKTTYDYSQIRPPPDWVDRYPGGNYTAEYPPPDLPNDELFQIWMRTAGLPNFRKLYGKNETDSLKAGTYEILIEYSKTNPIYSFIHLYMFIYNIVNK